MATFTADGDGDVFSVYGDARLHADGNFGGGSIQWNFWGQDGQWHPLANGAHIADHDVSVPVKGRMRVRPTLSGSAAPSIYYEAE